MGYDDDLRFAHVLADDADAQTMQRFRARDLRIDTKSDTTPVTDADRAAEEGIRRMLARARPRDAVVGEELGSEGWGSRRWVIDPIDGTKSYLRGVPVWATLIALMVDDDVVAGVVSAPALGRRWWAARGTGAWTGKSLAAATRCHVSVIDSLDQASLSYSSLAGWDETGRLEAFLHLMLACWRTRAYGDFWSYMLLADGAVDIATETGAGPARHGGTGGDRRGGGRTLHRFQRQARAAWDRGPRDQRRSARRGALDHRVTPSIR